MRVALLLSLVWLGCGPAARSTPTSEVAEVPGSELAGSEVAGSELAPEPAPPGPSELLLLGGRFAASLPGAPVPSDAWEARRATFDAYDVERNGCSLAVAVRSDGRLRPDALQPEGAERWLDPAPDGLAILLLPERGFATLSDELAAVGAVLFEEDGTATDLWVWPRLPSGEDLAEAGEDDDWLAAQRSDPRISNCFGEAERWLAEVLPTLRVRSPFASPSELDFGWDETREAQARYRATLPAGWVLTTAPAYDAEFTYLHPRLSWARSLATPSPSACIWMFVGDDPPPRRGRRRQVLGRTLMFDADGCAGFVLGDDLAVQHLCLTGTAAEQAAILEVLETFRPVAATD